MEQNNSTEDIRDFLIKNIESYEQLATLILLHANPGQAWTIADAAAKLNADPSDARRYLSHMVEHQLARAVGEKTFQYAPASEELAARVDRVLAVYADNALEIVKIMTKNAIERVRSSAMQTFADAFVVGKKKRDG